MRSIFVTGAAGFVGSSIARQYLRRGYRVVGIDNINDYYDASFKKARLEQLGVHKDFKFINGDILTCDFTAELKVAETVFHQAGQPGVRDSWSTGFEDYVSRNILATQTLLENCKTAQVGKIVYASSSSIYGNQRTYPCAETAVPKPYSPYGVTKLAAEHLMTLYAENFGLNTVSLRYFTVYGPEQRPDMAFHRFFEALLSGKPVSIYGDGLQERDFTYIDDVVEANRICAESDSIPPGSVFNVCGGTNITVNGVLQNIEDIAGSAVPVVQVAGVHGDVRKTGGNGDKLRDATGWKPATDIRTGLGAQLKWHELRRG